VLVTHDRYLLDRVTRRIVAVERGEARPYEGNYGTYLARRAEEEASASASEAKFRGSLRRELAWLRQGPKARSTKQKARLQRIEAMREAPVRQGRGQVSLASASRRLGKQVIRAEDLSVAAGAAGAAPLLEGFSYDFHAEDRVGIIGPNGVGKSTLLDVLAGLRPPSDGLLERGATVKLAYFDQHSQVLLAAKAERKVIDVVQEAASRVMVEGVELSASQLLERFLFPPAQQHQPVARLSGGERRRLHLCRLLIEAPNLLLLDEPTNDLDVATLTVLEEFLEGFRGCVVVVSHDRWFLDRTVDRLFCFRQGRLERFEGNYSAFLERQQATQAAAATPTPRPAAVLTPGSPSALAEGSAGDTASGAGPGTAGPLRRRSFRENRELEAIERDLPLWEERRRQLEASLAQPGEPRGEAVRSGGAYGRLEALTQELADLVERIATAEERWLELSERPG
jgi:ATP-binding cassette subfamily F protein uup